MFKYQALYYWLRTYLLERRDVANKSELSRMAMQRMQQNAPAASAGSLGLADGNARVQSHGGGNLSSDSQIHHGTSSSGIGTHDAGSSHGQEPERPTSAESSVITSSDQSLQQTINDGGQSALRRNGAVGMAAAHAVNAFDFAKDIMETLRSKHSNLASELEVTTLTPNFLFHSNDDTFIIWWVLYYNNIKCYHL